MPRATTQTEFTLQASAAVEKPTGKPARITILAYGGGVMRVSGLGNIAIALAGLERPGQVPLLLDHDNRLGAVAGHGVPTVKGGKLTIAGEILRDTEAGSQVLTLSKGGLALQASVGVEVKTSEYIGAGDSIKVNGRTVIAPTGGLTVVKTGRLREVSLTPAGADSGTKVSIAASRGRPMLTEAEIRASERERLTQIDSILDGLTGQAVTELRAGAIAGDIGLDVLQGHALDIMRASRPTAPAPGSYARGASSPDILAAAVLGHLGHNAERLISPAAAEGAHAMGVTSMADICRAALANEGRPIPRSIGAMVSAGFSTESLPTALSDAAGKIVLESYDAAPASWRGFANVLPLNDFKTADTIRPSFNGQLQKLAPDGEIKHGTISEETGEIKLDTFAQMLRISRQSVINDDGGVFDQVASGLGKNAARAVADAVYTVLLANGGSFFHADNSNLITGPSTILSLAGLIAAMAAMTTQRDAAGRDLDIRPRTLLVPAELEASGRQLLTSEAMTRYVSETVDQQAQGNPIHGQLTLAVEPRLSNSNFTGYSATQWFLFAAPQDAALNVGFLGGVQNPTIETFGPGDQADVLAFAWRCYLDFGAALGDYRAAARSNGA